MAATDVSPASAFQQSSASEMRLIFERAGVVLTL